MPDDKQLGLLKDILDSASAIRSYMQGISREDFMANQEKQDAVLRRFEIIGEASSRLSPETKQLFPNMPFRDMRGMRNVIAHDYGDVNLQRIWQTTIDPLQELLTELESYFATQP